MTSSGHFPPQPIAILRLLGFASISHGLRHFARRPRLALQALGL